MAVMLTSTKQYVDLISPDLSRIDIRTDIALPLARAGRFACHMEWSRSDGRIWSVGQHCVVGAKAMLEETDDVDLALAFLVHDAHEALIGDITTPTRTTIGEMMGPVARKLYEAAIVRLKAAIDVEIRRLAGLRMSEAMTRTVHQMDMRMLAAEVRQILGEEPSDHPAHWPAECLTLPAVVTRGALCPWPTKRVADEWMALWDAWVHPARADIWTDRGGGSTSTSAIAPEAAMSSGPDDPTRREIDRALRDGRMRRIETGRRALSDPVPLPAKPKIDPDRVGGGGRRIDPHPDLSHLEGDFE
jgi:hypothetical protein